jgi:hypothetical protein
MMLFIAFTVDAAAASHSGIDAFANRIKGVTWNLRGTNALKGLEFDGKDVREVKAGGAKGGVYESAFVDVGVLRLNFRGPNTGWYFSAKICASSHRSRHRERWSSSFPQGRRRSRCANFPRTSPA